jgi:transposase
MALQRRGNPRKLTDQQIKRVLSIYAERAAFRVLQGTVLDLAKRLDVSVNPVRYMIRRAAVAQRSDPVEWSKLDGLGRAALLTRRRGAGRRSSLKTEQQLEVLKWHAESVDAYAARGSIIKLCREWGISSTSIRQCIRRGGGVQTSASRRFQGLASET